MYRLTIYQNSCIYDVFLHNDIKTVLDMLKRLIIENGYSSCCYTCRTQYSQYKSMEPVLSFIEQNPISGHHIEFPDKKIVIIEPSKHPMDDS